MPHFDIVRKSAPAETFRVASVAGTYDLQTTEIEEPYKNPTDKRIAKRIAEGHEGGMLYDWWEINQVKNVSKDKNG